ncbi:MAG: hypothetical protein U5K69_05750 [Balneolaceae bacterium]|nr:hypothetical protein [Balneolaceae bacterium]
MANFLLVNITIFHFLTGGFGITTGDHIPAFANTYTPDNFNLVEMATSDTLPLPAPEQNSLAPGSAKIKANIVQLDDSTGVPILVLTIVEALGYGSATPPLATGREITVESDSYFKNYPHQQHKVATCDTFTVVIRHLPTLNKDDSSPDWSLVKISKD